MNYEQILYEMDGPVLRVTCNRPRYRNAQSRRLLEELDHAFARAADDLGVHVIVLLGAGDHFSGGHDLGTPEELADRRQRPYQEGIRGRFQRTRDLHVEMTLRWRNVPKPTIAAVQGYCIFGGWMIASAMDFIFAADDAMFLGANFQYFSIPWDIHPRKAKEILYASRFIDAPEALELGLVNRVIPRDRLLAETMDYANLVAQNDPFQLRMIKMAVNQQQDGQGFAAHLTAAHAMHILSAVGESDPDYALQKPAGRRRPMVQRAFENYTAHRRQQDDTRS